MKFHSEGTNILLITIIAVMALNVASFAAMGASHAATVAILVLSLVYLFLSFYFFRVPNRPVPALAPNTLVCPSDGKVVVIEKVFEGHFFNEERLQVSIFMSPLNVHINWYPINGTVVASEYNPGKFLVAWHPKSSSLNESHSIVMEHGGQQILVKQIAGAAARRIVNYAEVGQKANLGSELGFIKFGSRVDILLPVDAKVAVQLGQTVTGLQTVLAELNPSPAVS